MAFRGLPDLVPMMISEVKRLRVESKTEELKNFHKDAESGNFLRYPTRTDYSRCRAAKRRLLRWPK